MKDGRLENDSFIVSIIFSFLYCITPGSDFGKETFIKKTASNIERHRKGLEKTLKRHLLKTSKNDMSQPKANYKDSLPLNNGILGAMMLLDVEPKMKYYGIDQNEWPQSKLVANKKVAAEGVAKTKTKFKIAGNGNKYKNGQSENKRKPVAVSRSGK